MHKAKAWMCSFGTVQAALNNNPDLDKAIEVLQDTTLYNKVFEVVK